MLEYNIRAFVFPVSSPMCSQRRPISLLIYSYALQERVPVPSFHNEPVHFPELGFPLSGLGPLSHRPGRAICSVTRH